MIVDRLENAARYASLHPLFGRALAWLKANQNAALEAGRHDLEGANGAALHVMASRAAGRGRANPLEAHRRYIDIHFTLQGVEEIGWKSASLCAQRKTAFDAASDCEFFGDAPDCWTTLPAGVFAIYFPQDAHAPLCGQGEILKYVVKVALNPS